MSSDDETPLEVPAAASSASKREWWGFRVIARPARGIPAERAHWRIGGENDEQIRALWFIPEEGREPNAREWREIVHLVEVGALIRLPLGEIGEPIECFDSQDDADKWREASSLKFPWQQFKVILTWELDELEAKS